MLKKRYKYLSILAAGFLIVGCDNQENDTISEEPSEHISEYNNEKITDITNNLVKLNINEESENFTYYDLEVQNELQNQIADLKGNDFTSENPLFILNPYGTINNGLYVHFKDDQIKNVEYTIQVDDESIPDLTETAVNHGDTESEEIEILVFGLVPDEKNKLTLTYFDENDEVVSTEEYLISMKPTTPDHVSNKIDVIVDNDVDQMTDQYFTLIGNSGSESLYQYIFDNDGIIRAEIETFNFRLNNIHRLNENEFIMDVGSSKIITMNGLGGVEQVYDFEGYTTHHDFILTEDNGVLVLVNDDEADTVEDIILHIDLDTGEYHELIDLKDYFPNFLETFEFEINRSYSDRIDWAHINSIDLINEDEIVLSAREMQAAIKMSNIFDNPQVDYLIGIEDIWEGTDYKELLLDQETDFTLHAGQHAIQFMEDDDLEDGEYYLTMFNNNYSKVASRPDIDFENFSDETHPEREPNEEYNSFYYKYKVNEKEGTFDLVKEFAVPYSSIVSNVQHIEDNIVINSGMANKVAEYDSEGNILRQYEYDINEWAYRVLKRDYSGFFYQ